MTSISMGVKLRVFGCKCSMLSPSKLKCGPIGLVESRVSKKLNWMRSNLKQAEDIHQIMH